jgi:AcrR family transcriptional regulator
MYRTRTVERAAAQSSRGLTLDVIVEAAVEMVGEDGVEALSMRHLGARLGVGAMTLYGYVRTKEELLGEVANRFLNEIELPDPALPWQAQVTELFRSARRVFLEHPALIPIAAGQRIDATGAYRGAEVVFAALRDAGLPDERIVGAFDALVSFTIGATQREAGLSAQARDPLPGIQALDPEQYPHVVALAAPLAARDPARDFEVGLALLIAGMGASR